jgi:hypothetical protein
MIAHDTRRKNETVFYMNACCFSNGYVLIRSLQSGPQVVLAARWHDAQYFWLSKFSVTRCRQGPNLTSSLSFCSRTDLLIIFRWRFLSTCYFTSHVVLTIKVVVFAVGWRHRPNVHHNSVSGYRFPVVPMLHFWSIHSRLQFIPFWR